MEGIYFTILSAACSCGEHIVTGVMGDPGAKAPEAIPPAEISSVRRN